MPSRSSVPYRLLIRTTAAGALLVTALFAATPAEAVGQEETSDRPAANPPDVESPGAVVEALAASFSLEAGERPEWDRYRSLFLPKARLVRTRSRFGGRALPWGLDGPTGDRERRHRTAHRGTRRRAGRPRGDWSRPAFVDTPTAQCSTVHGSGSTPALCLQVSVAGGHSVTTSSPSSRIASETLKRFGERRVTTSWISRYCSGVPSPFIVTR